MPRVYDLEEWANLGKTQEIHDRQCFDNTKKDPAYPFKSHENTEGAERGRGRTRRLLPLLLPILLPLLLTILLRFSFHPPPLLLPILVIDTLSLLPSLYVCYPSTNIPSLHQRIAQLQLHLGTGH